MGIEGKEVHILYLTPRALTGEEILEKKIRTNDGWTKLGPCNCVRGE